MRNPSKISVVVPAHNEEENIPELLRRFERMFETSGLAGEVIVVNDGSTDGTAGRVREGMERYPFVKTVDLPFRRGITAALEEGIGRAAGEIIVFYPADLQYLPEDIPSLTAKIDEGFDIVTGWRQGRYGGRRFVHSVYNLLSRLFFKVSVHDLNSVKAFKKEVFTRLPLQPNWHRYLVVLAASQGCRVGEVKVTLHPREHGESKFGRSRVLPAFWDFVVVLFVVKYSQKPMQLFGNLGLLFTIAGVAIAAYLTVIWFKGMRIGDRPLLLLAILLIFVGIQFLALGLIGELINRRNRR